MASNGRAIRLYSAHKDATQAFVQGRGKHAYLWIGTEDRCDTWVSGPATLRKIALAVLAEVGEADDE